MSGSYLHVKKHWKCEDIANTKFKWCKTWGKGIAHCAPSNGCSDWIVDYKLGNVVSDNWETLNRKVEEDSLRMSSELLFMAANAIKSLDHKFLSMLIDVQKHISKEMDSNTWKRMYE